MGHYMQRCCLVFQQHVAKCVVTLEVGASTSMGQLLQHTSVRHMSTLAE